jgi:hypothetical protein
MAEMADLKVLAGAAPLQATGYAEISATPAKMPAL